MSVKQFFKSTAFKSLAVLLSIVIVAGGLLAICNDLFFISDEERFNRSLEKIYPNGATVEKELTLTEENRLYADGKIELAYLMSDGNYLVKSTGYGAYKNGTVTAWVVVEMKDGALNGVGKVLYESTTVGNFFAVSQDFYDGFDTNDEAVVEGKEFSVSADGGIPHPSSGATYSANAINNAVNTAVEFIKTSELGIKEEVKFEFEQYFDLSTSVVTVNGAEKKVDYRLSVKASLPVPAFTAIVTVTNGAVSAFSTEGSFVSKEEYINWVDAPVRDGSKFIGMKESDIRALLGADGVVSKEDLEGAGIATGTTLSTSALIYPVAFALCNADYFLEGGTLA